MAQNGKLEPAVFTIFGAAGDLAKRKLIPALYNLYLDNSLPDRFAIVGICRRADDHGKFKEMLREGVDSFSRSGKADPAVWDKFESCIRLIEGTFEDPGVYDNLAKLIANFEHEWHAKAVRVYYMSTPPSFVPTIVDRLDHAKLNKDRKRDRIVCEKPFGRDLASAEALNKVLTASYQESQIYRIDHYLGKETVQNILAFRFGNAMYEPIWDRKYIDHVQITVAEDVGVEKRGEEHYQLLLGGSGAEDAAIGDITGPGFGPDGIVDAAAETLTL